MQLIATNACLAKLMVIAFAAHSLYENVFRQRLRFFLGLKHLGIACREITKHARHTSFGVFTIKFKAK